MSSCVILELAIEDDFLCPAVLLVAEVPVAPPPVMLVDRFAEVAPTPVRSYIKRRYRMSLNLSKKKTV